jgi:gliding motility-associated-like protein
MMRRAHPSVVLAFFLAGWATAAQAQYNSRLGRFQVDQVKGCAPFIVTITNTNLITTGECTPGKPCLMDYESKGQQQNVFTYTYTTPGTFRLSVLYQSIGADDITITVDQNIEPNFEIYSCSGHRTSIRVTDNNYDQYVIDFNNDNIPETILPFGTNITAQHAYSPAGTYTIAVRGRDLNAADNCRAKTQTITTLATLPRPTLNSVVALDAGSADIAYTIQNNIQYRLEVAVNNASSFQLLRNVYGGNKFTATNLRLDDNYYCFRIGAFDPCSNTTTYSSTVCTQNFDVAAQSARNQLTWATSTTGITRVEIQRDQKPYTTIPGAPLAFTDQDVTCNTTYCYRLTTRYASGASSTSLEKCVDAFVNTAPPAIENVSAVVGNGVQLSWLSNPQQKVKAFDILRFLNNNTFPGGNTTDNTFTDSFFDAATRVCYQVNYEDLCENRSLVGIITCPVRLQGNMDSRNAVTLNWTKFTGWRNGVRNYTVEKYDIDNRLIRTFNTALDTTLVDDTPDLNNQVISYRVVATPATSNLGLPASVSNEVTFRKEVALTFPTAFTPNKDGLNDQFTITGQYVESMKIRIFDRWGTLIFASDKNEPWDGTRSFLPMPEGTYVWKAEITDLSGRVFSREGTLVLLRK